MPNIDRYFKRLLAAVFGGGLLLLGAGLYALLHRNYQAGPVVLERQERER